MELLRGKASIAADRHGPHDEVGADMDEKSARDELMAQYQRGYPRALASDPLLRWKDTVEDVEQNGYTMSLDDWEQDMFFRSAIESWLGLVSSDARALLTPVLTELDERFAAVTIWKSPQRERWWESAFPKQPGEELREELEYPSEASYIDDYVLQQLRPRSSQPPARGSGT